MPWSRCSISVPGRIPTRTGTPRPPCDPPSLWCPSPTRAARACSHTAWASAAPPLQKSARTAAGRAAWVRILLVLGCVMWHDEGYLSFPLLYLDSFQLSGLDTGTADIGRALLLTRLSLGLLWKVLHYKGNRVSFQMHGRGTTAGSLVRMKRAGRVQEVDSQASEMC